MVLQARCYVFLPLVALAIAVHGQPILGSEAGGPVASAAPLPVLLSSRLREEHLGYRVTVSMAGSEQIGSADLSIAKDWTEHDADRQEVWRVEFRELAPLSRGNVFILRSTDLGMLERRITMQVTSPDTPSADRSELSLRFSADTVSVVGDQQIVPLPVPVLANWDIAVVALPLAEGFETSAHTFEYPHQTVGWKVAVAGVEVVETPAGLFESFKVALTCVDNNALSVTAWVSRDAPYRIVRRESAYMPELMVGKMTIELASIETAGGTPTE